MTGQTQFPDRSPAEWVAALQSRGWKGRKVGSEWKGPCPVCGGDDRFHVKEGRKKVLVGCRVCEAPYAKLAKTVLGNGQPTGSTMDPPDWDAAREREREKEERAYNLMRKRWRDAEECDACGYFNSRGYNTPKGLRMDRDGAMTLVPMYPAGAKDYDDVAGVQRIWQQRSKWIKRYAKASRPTGASYVLPTKAPRTRFYVAEGITTAQALATAIEGTPFDGRVVVGFSAGNLEPVASAIRRKYENLEIVLCADNDRGTEGNPGVKHARKAAEAVGGRCVIPPCTGGRKSVDFDDLYREGGRDAVLDRLRSDAPPTDTGPYTRAKSTPGEKGERKGETASATARTAKQPKPLMLADNELADLLPDDDRTRWIWDPRRGWFVAPSGGWAWRQDHRACELRSTLRTLAEDKAGDRPLKLRHTTIAGAVKMTEAEVIDEPAWDADPMIAGLPGGGVLDLTTGDTRKPERDDFVSRQLGMLPKDGGEPTRFLEFLHEITGDETTADYMIGWAAYALTGHSHVSDHVVPMMIGDGGSGKTTLTLILAKLWGDYSVQLPADVLVARRQAREAHPEWMTRLDGGRLAIATEIPGTGNLRASTFKDLTGGGVMRAHLMRQNSYEFRPTAKIMLFGNAVPGMAGWDSGLKRRMVMVPCQSKPKADRIEDLASIILEDEGREILHYLANRAASDYDRHAEGKPWLPDPSTASAKETDEAFAAADPLGQAIKATFRITGRMEDRIPSKDVRLRLETTYKQEGFGKRLPSSQIVAAALKRVAKKEKKWVESQPGKGGSNWHGIVGRSID